jgi:hypothetical protein
VKRVAVGAALFFWATACVTPIPPQPLSPGDPRPRRLLDDWVERTSERQRLRGLARLAVDRNDGSIRLRGKQLVVLERPSRLRVEILGFLNQSLAVIATDGERFEVYRAEDQSYEAGEVDDRLLWNEAGIDLSPEEAVAVLLGVPISEPLPAPVNAVRDGDGRIQIDLADTQGTVVERATFDSAGRLHAFEVLDDSGAVVWAAQFGEYRDVGGSPFAHSIGLDVRSGKTHAEISFRKVELNPNLPPGLFRLFPTREGDPPGAGADGR